MLLSLVHFGTWTLTILLIWVGGGGSALGVVMGSQVCGNHPHAQAGGLGIWHWLSKCVPGTSGSTVPSNLLGMQILGLPPLPSHLSRSLESDTLEVGPSTLCRSQRQF